MNKYLLKLILSYTTTKFRLNLLKYNKKLQSKLGISLYSIQKEYYYSIITETLLKNEDILEKVFDKETLNKLNSDFENDKKDIYKDQNLFRKIGDLEILKIIKKSPNIDLPNLLELNLFSIDEIEIPCIIFSNLEKLSLNRISNLRFLTNELIISLKKLKYFQFLETIISEENKNIKLKMDNLIYLDIKLSMTDDDKEYYDLEDTVMFFENLNNLIKIFDLVFSHYFH